MVKIDFELPEIPRSKMEIVCEVLSVIGIILALILVFGKYAGLPDMVPSHFGPNGMPDAWDKKSTILFLVGVMIFVYIIISISRIFPKLINLNVTITKENAVRVMSVIYSGLSLTKLICIGMIYYIINGIILTAEGNANGLGMGIWIFVVALLVTVFGMQIVCSKTAKKTDRF